jgi:hypothetical protein
MCYSTTGLYGAPGHSVNGIRVDLVEYPGSICNQTKRIRAAVIHAQASHIQLKLLELLTLIFNSASSSAAHYSSLLIGHQLIAYLIRCSMTTPQADNQLQTLGHLVPHPCSA